LPSPGGKITRGDSRHPLLACQVISRIDGRAISTLDEEVLTRLLAKEADELYDPIHLVALGVQGVGVETEHLSHFIKDCLKREIRKKCVALLPVGRHSVGVLCL
jgi:hypothetical protein